MITLYGFNDCPYCNELKEFFDKDKIQYRYVDIDLPEHQEEVDKIMEIGKADEVPLILVNKQLLVPNVSFHTIKEGYELTKKLML